MARTVAYLGRWIVAGNTGKHTVKLVNASTGLDVPGASVVIDASKFAGGGYGYEPLPAPVTLPAGQSFYLVTEEYAGGDKWYDWGAVTSNSPASVLGAAYQAAGNGGYVVEAAGSVSYGPPSFLYQ